MFRELRPPSIIIRKNICKKAAVIGDSNRSSMAIYQAGTALSFILWRVFVTRGPQLYSLKSRTPPLKICGEILRSHIHVWDQLRTPRFIQLDQRFYGVSVYDEAVTLYRCGTGGGSPLLL